MDETSAQHSRSRDWLTTALNGDERVGRPWLSLGAFMRIATNPRAATEAWGFIVAALRAPRPDRGRRAEFTGRASR